MTQDEKNSVQIARELGVTVEQYLAIGAALDREIRGQLADKIAAQKPGPGSAHYAHGFECAVENSAQIARGES